MKKIVKISSVVLAATIGIMLLLSVWGGVIVSFAVYDKHRKDNKASLELESEVVAFGNIGAHCVLLGVSG